MPGYIWTSAASQANHGRDRLFPLTGAHQVPSRLLAQR